ncbi:hypothetical protein M8C21_000112 [Ambrosia artemisiifolia]|uniref:UvrD-like helicase ATP-binding domain-containing protein n=1 Tax=Ambrosia artemisiifolia TaxID=4212 RepID=A0AAD5GQT2_AMBAR|nr:hypothetical protein M8C21_000112 [Ambrosia artemisiifolia]
MMQRWKKKDEFEKNVFSWSVDDILNDDLYKHQVEKIPLTFQSEEQYVGSFVHPLLEETRAELASSLKIMYKAPNAGIFSLKKTKDDGKMMYEVTVGNWRNRSSEHGKEPYRTLPGDLLILVDGKPESLSDLQRVGRTCVFSLVNQISDDGNDSTSISFEVKTSQQIEFQDGMFAVFLINITTNKRIWNSLHMQPNTNIIKEILYSDSMVKECCDICSSDSSFSQKFDPHLLEKLNKSQARAVREALRKTECCHGSFVEQIWGPPGTGKTTTVSVLLFILLQMKRRTLTCTPTNVAVVQVASRVLNLVKGSFKTTTASGDFFYCIGDVLLLGNKQRLNVGSEIEDIYLENRVKKLTECLGSLTGWKHCIKSMIDLLDGCVSQYHVFVDNELLKDEQLAAVNKKEKAAKLEVKSFIDFVRDRFNSCVQPLRRCILTFLTHISRSFIGEHNFQNMVSLLDDLSFYQLLLFEEKLVSEELEQIFTSEPLQNDFDKSDDMSSINLFRANSLSVLRTLQTSLEGLGFPSVFKRSAIEDFCFQNASLIFCTISTSYKLRHAVKMKPLEVLVIDEAAQLKEAESIIPLRLPAIKHAILIGDECQLPAMVSSTACSESGFGRSLFGRLTSLGHSKHLLEEQYRMHPSITWQNSRKRVTIGVVSPYGAQVDSIQEKLAHKYEKHDGFSVTANTIDGFQGGEEDIIILSTVRSNSHGSVGFLSSDQRTNVALTRARHCLWILGNERTLSNSDCVWKELVYDARNRGCLFDADADKCLKMTIIDAKKELGQLDDLVNGNSVHFKHENWKVLFSDDFRKSFGKLTVHLKKLVLNLLLTHSGGWRPNNRSVDVCRESSSKMLKKIKVEGLNLKVPKVWSASEEFIKFRYLSNHEDDCEASVNPGDGRTYVQNSKVNDSLLLMKFYSLSPGVVSHLLSGKELDIPMQVTDEQMDIILFCKSSFIIGRPGTGRTTILTMKLFQNEQNFRVSSKKINESQNNRIGDAKVVDNSESSKPSILRQLFVTVSPKLCYDVKQDVSHLTSISCHGSSLEEINLEDTYFTSDFNDIPDTFVEIPVKMYPLVITFHKFIMMLDGTLGNSYFERFLEAKEGYQSNHISSGSVALQTFVRLKEVTFDRFCSLYWPHFNSNHKKKLDPSLVFNEIISYIKGGMQVGECSDGKLSIEGYCSLAESCSSTLTRHKREYVYSLFQAYENMKTQRGEFDLGDLVNDLHRRLKNANYEGDQMDFIYIDEVQDLSMRQISLFKYICQNVDMGFTFAGDTAQIIARGINFRFQDLRSLFYKEFLSSKTTGKQNKSLVSEIFQLKQNFRTHASVLNLAQSVIDIVYCYFAHSIDILEPEISLIHGEAPVLLESVNGEKSIVTIFGGSGSGKEVGFDAERVILVRDDIAKTEICEYIGKQTLVLTIGECKGLEFQDVLLYNFFGTSPFKDRWKVIYGYMKEQDWLDEKLPQSFPNFSESRHGVLCSELKLLYMAITRTRQRLWIYENNEELSKPMFDYWKRRGLVQVRKLDDSVAHSMRVATSPQEWREWGKMLFYENNFVRATMCFERAGDRVWETLAKASGLRAFGDQIRGANLEAFISHVREAAAMFESIGKLESAASCFCDLGEYETAGKIYMYKCGKMDEAAECFTLAGCYSDAAKAYAKGDKLSKCLSVCKKGKLFDNGLQYIEEWKKHVSVQSKEVELIEQEFLESCALYYHEHKDPNSMMKFVEAFCSIESKRVFLRSLGCLDHLLKLEEELGHFLDAAELARSLGDVYKEAELLEKGGHVNEATVLLLWYVFFSSLWGNGNKGWPVKQFAQKEELSGKAKLLAKTELKLLSDEHFSLLELTKDLHVSQKHKSLRGEIFFIRRILDAHIGLKSSKYDCEDELPIDINKHCEDKIFQNRVSVRTLLFYWNAWKENVMGIFSSLESFHKKEPDEYEARVEFIFNYFGVRKQCVKGNIVYMLVNKDADWIRNSDQKGLWRDGKPLTIDARDLVDSMRSYWQSELISVGIKVLETLERLLQKSKSNGSAFHQSTSLLHIFEVSKFLLNFQDVNPKDTKKLERFLRISSTYFDLVFSLDWRRSVSQDLISLRETDLSLNLLEEIIRQTVDIKGEITNWAIGRVMIICLGSRKPIALYEHIVTRIQRNLPWKSFFEKFMGGSFDDNLVSQSLIGALGANYAFNWGSSRSISPQSFVYLLESLLFMTSFSSRIFFTTRSSFVGLFTHVHPTSTYLAPKRIIPDYAVRYIVGMIEQILFNKDDILSWIQRSNMDSSYYHPLLSLKLVMILSLICLQVSDHSRVLLDLLAGKNNIAYLLPKKFVHHLLRRRKGHNLNLKPDVVAEAFVSIEDPLLIVCAGNASPGIHAPCAVFVDLRKSKKDILNVLFLRKTPLCVKEPSNNDDCGMIREASSSNPLLAENLNVNPVKLRMNWQVLEDIAEAFNGTKGLELNNFMIKRELDKIKAMLATALADKKLCAGKDATVVHEANVDLKLLSSSLIYSIQKIREHSLFMKTVQGFVERLQSRRPKIDDFLNSSAVSLESKIGKMVVSESSRTAEIGETGAVLTEVENQSGGGGNTQDAENEKVKKKRNRRNKGNKKSCDESKIWHMVVSESGSTFEIGETSAENNHVKETGADLAEVDNQSGNGGNNQDAENEKGKKRRSRRSRGKKN